MIKVGDRVEINNNCIVEDWVGEQGVIYNVGSSTAFVRLDRRVVLQEQYTKELALDIDKFTLVENEEDNSTMEFYEGMILVCLDGQYKNDIITLKDNYTGTTWTVEEGGKGVYTEDYLANNYKEIKKRHILKYPVGTKVKLHGQIREIVELNYEAVDVDDSENYFAYRLNDAFDYCGLGNDYFYCQSTIEGLEPLSEDDIKLYEARLQTTLEPVKPPEDEPVQEINVGDRVRVIGDNAGHEFLHGEELVIAFVDEWSEVPYVGKRVDDYEGVISGTEAFWSDDHHWLGKDDVELIEKADDRFKGWAVGKRVKRTEYSPIYQTYDVIEDYDPDDNHLPFYLQDFGWVHNDDAYLYELLPDEDDEPNCDGVSDSMVMFDEIHSWEDDEHDEGGSFEFASINIHVSLDANNPDKDVITLISYEDGSLELCIEQEEEAVSIDLPLETVEKINNVLSAHVNLNKVL